MAGNVYNLIWTPPDELVFILMIIQQCSAMILINHHGPPSLQIRQITIQYLTLPKTPPDSLSQEKLREFVIWIIFDTTQSRYFCQFLFCILLDHHLRFKKNSRWSFDLNVDCIKREWCLHISDQLCRVQIIQLAESPPSNATISPTTLR